MSFFNVIQNYRAADIAAHLSSVTLEDVHCSLAKDRLTPYDLLNLLSDTAQDALEAMAVKAGQITRQYFGRTIGIYAPLYISDYCSNHCTYCGFNCNTQTRRLKLSIEQIEAEARVIAGMGIRHILILTGEAPSITPISYLESVVTLLKRYFSSIGIEIFPMDEDDYQTLKTAGVDALTVYQEVYDPAIYKTVHLKGRKTDYAYRLLTPERGARAGFRSVNIGPLFGLGVPASEAFLAGLHARYLEKMFPDVEISLSLPRMTPAAGGILPRHTVSDAQFVQFMLAWRLFMPRLGITISTRESADFRDRLLPLGVTRYSAGSKTDVGGYALKDHTVTPQFAVTDTRSVDQICQMIRKRGYQPIFKDWERV